VTDTATILKSHPSPAAHADKLAACIDACRACLVSCTSCADACIGGYDPKAMAECIRTDLDCADICAATIAVLTRQTNTNAAVQRAQLQAMVAACKACGDTCMSHADKHEHCKLCGQTCRECEQACNDLLSNL
jgi:hypothetical protein